MAQRDGGLWAPLSRAWFYDFFLRILGERRARATVVRDYVKASPGTRLLDLGCGTGRTLDFTHPDVEYVGIDVSAPYIQAARARYGERGRFILAPVQEAPLRDLGRFETAYAGALLHHLDDAACIRLLEAVNMLLVPRGRFVSFDCVYTKGQNRVARLLIDHDRGRHVRTVEGYTALARTVFADVGATVREDLLRVPYSHLMMECQR